MEHASYWLGDGKQGGRATGPDTTTDPQGTTMTDLIDAAAGLGGLPSICQPGSLPVLRTASAGTNCARRRSSSQMVSGYSGYAANAACPRKPWPTGPG